MMVAELIKKQMWILNLVFVIAMAYLTATGINMRVASEFDSAPRIDLMSRGAGSPQTYPPIENYNIVLERNLFNSAAVILETLTKLASAVGLEVNPTDLDLIGTMAGPPEVSLALISNKNDGNKTDVYRWGDKVGEYTITAIERRLVRLVKEEREEVLKMPGERMAFAIDKSFESSDPTEGIKQVGEDERVVDRRLIDDSLENFGKLMRQARIIPHLKDGKIDGFKVYRIKKDSLFEKIGLVNGDIIRRVNGSEIEGPEDGLKLFEVFKTAKSITIDMDRNGQKKTLSYTVR